MKNEFSISEAAGLLRVHPRSLRDWIQSGRFVARRKGRRYFLDGTLVRKLQAKQDRVHVWPRLVDVSRGLGIHRNQGESLCRAGGFAIEKDLTDDCRIPPEAVAYLIHCVEVEAARQDWMPLIKLAEELKVPRNVLDGGLRKQRLEFAKDHSGQIILPPASAERLRAWRRKLDGYRSQGTMIDGQLVHPLHATAAMAAEKFANPGTEAHEKKTQALIYRYRYWAKEGLPVARYDRQLFLDAKTHAALVDDVSLIEASRLTGVNIGRLKRWAARGLIQQTQISPTRKSFSFTGLVATVAALAQADARGRFKGGIPVQTIPPWSELAARLRPPQNAPLARLLELSAGASAAEIEALQSGIGFISRPLWKIVEEWLRAAGSGRLPPKPAMDTEQHRECLVRAPELPSLLSWFSGIREDHFANVLRPGLRGRVSPDELTAVCSQLTAGRPVRVYDPDRTYRGGEFLVDSTGEDLGSVQAVHRSHIEVSWIRRGSLKMSHREAGSFN